MRHGFRLFAALLACCISSEIAAAQRTPLKPGWNMFSPDQDVEIGKRAAVDAQKKLPLCNLPDVDEYLTQLGKRLTAHLPDNPAQYHWEFHCVNDKAINAFALPGGFVFVNRGAIESSDNEGQLAGVMAHELSHVVLRHGTNQATKAQLTQGILGVAGGIFGGSASGALLTELGSFAAGGVLLRYSRGAESQADVLGTQDLYDAGYDPRALAQFFEKLDAESKGKNPPEFLSDHPNPEHRVDRVMEEIEKLGGVPANAKKDSPEFERVKRELLALPPPPKGPTAAARVSIPPPSGSFTQYRSASYSLSYPDNWEKYPDRKGEGVSFSPPGGVVESGSSGALAYGLIVGTAALPGSGSESDRLAGGTRQLIEGLQKSNLNMQVTQQPSKKQVDGKPALSTYLSNDSPVGSKETDWLVTVLRSQDLFYFVCVAPSDAFDSYAGTCSSVLNTARLAE
jgi:beta-barrel assembly-enhancing protease